MAGKVAFAIITIREDECRAVLARFTPHELLTGERTYSIHRLSSESASFVAIVRCPDQGQGDAQNVARDLIQDLDPEWLVLVGIAGAVPDNELTLGDVIVASRLHDFCLEATHDEGMREFGVRGAPMHMAAQDVIATLPAIECRLGPWNTVEALTVARPPVKLSPKNFYGDAAFKREVRSKIAGFFGPGVPPRAPRATTGAIASSDRLVKSTSLITTWRQVARQIRSVEMELAGVYQAARRRDCEYPILAIRGISDIVGFKRDAAWTEYACHSAASFASALIRSGCVGRGRIARTTHKLSEVPVHLPTAASLVETPALAPVDGMTQLGDGVDFTGMAQRYKDDLSQALLCLELDRAKEIAAAATAWERRSGHLARPAALADLLLALANFAMNLAKTASNRAVQLELASQYLERARTRMRDPMIQDKLVALRAHLDAVGGNVDAALAALADRGDSESVYRRLSILLENERFEDAARLARGHALTERWADRAASAFAAVGDVEGARGVITWARDKASPLVTLRCRVALAESVWNRITSRSGRHRALVMAKPIAGEEATLVQAALHALGPVVALVRANGQVQTNLEEYGVALLLSLGRLEGNAPDSELVEALGRRRPISLPFAQAVLSEACAAPADICTRLRIERPDSFDAALLASLIQATSFNDPSGAFEEALKLIPRAKSDEDKSSLLQGLINIAQHAGSDAEDRIESVALALGSVGGTILPVFRAVRLLRRGDATEAGALLERCRDEEDPHWLQGQAMLLLQQGKAEDAARTFAQAAELWPDLPLLRRAAELNYKIGRLDVTTKCQEMICHVQPQDPSARRRLAFLHAEQGNTEAAIANFERLAILDPSDGPRLALAQLYAQSFDRERSLEIFTSLCQGRESPPMEAVIGRSQVLRSLGRSTDAFKCLSDFKDAFWEDPTFLSTYMSVGYDSGNDEKASLALKQLEGLQDDGRLAKPVLMKLTMKKLLRQFTSRRSEVEQTHRHILAGRLPWLMHEERAAVASAIGWQERTQPLSWVPDDVVSRVRFSVYSTNAFGVRVGATGSKEQDSELVLIRAPGPSTEIVVDLSALLTLSALDLLDATGDYFGTIRYPFSYLSYAFEDSAQMPSVQQSQRHAFERVRAALDAGRIRSSDSAAARRVEWKENSRAGSVSVAAVIRCMQSAGRVRDDLAQRLLERFGKQSSGRPAKSRKVAKGEVTIGSPLRADASILAFCVNVSVFDSLIESFDVCMDDRARNEVASFLEFARVRSQVADQHARLWDHIRSSARFSATPDSRLVSSSVGDDEDTRRSKTAKLIASFALAEERRLPLLCDDRFLQAGAHRRWTGDPCTGFGSDSVIFALLKAGRIDLPRAAGALTDLIRWRYRFLLLPPSILLELARQNASHPPGDSLVAVAVYVHDAMRDPGLFSGFEATNPPAAISLRFYLSWVQTIAEFIIDAWYAPEFTPKALEELTVWCVREFLPPAPVTLPRAQGAVSPGLSEHVIQHAVFRASGRSDPAPAGRALVCIAEAFGMTPEDYFKVAIRLFHLYAAAGTSGPAPVVDPNYRGPPIERLVAARLARVMFAEVATVRPNIGSLLLELGVIDREPEEASERESHAFVQGLLAGTPSSLLSAPDVPRGPIAFFRRQTPGHGTIDLLGFLFSRDSLTRRLTLERFGREVAAEPDLLCPSSRMALAQAQASAASEDWHASVSAAHDQLKDDIRFNLAGLRQAVATRELGLLREYADRLLRPQTPAIHNLETVPFFVDAEVKAMSDRVSAIADRGVAAGLDEFYAHFGHMPFAEAGSISSFVEAALEKGTSNPKLAFREVCAWAARHTGPIAEWHVCALAMTRPELVPEDDRRAVWANVVRVMKADDPSWRWYNSILTHLVKWIGCQCPDRRADWIVSVSSWVATRLADVVLDDTQRKVMERALTGAADLTQQAWTFAGWAGDYSRLRHLSEFGLKPWAVSLACAISARAGALDPVGSLTAAEINSVELVIGGAVLRAISARAISPDSARLWVERSVRASATAWTETVGDERGLGTVVKGFAPQRWTEEPSQLLKDLKRLMDMGDEERAVFLSALRLLALTEVLSPDSVASVVSDADWVAKTCTLSFTESECLCHAILALYVRSHDIRLLAFPFGVADAVRRLDLSGEQSRALVLWVLLFSLVGQCVGPLVRLVEAPVPKYVADHVQFFRTLMYSQLSYGQTFPVIAGRCRPLVLLLRKYFRASFEAPGSRDTSTAETPAAAATGPGRGKRPPTRARGATKKATKTRPAGKNAKATRESTKAASKKKGSTAAKGSAGARRTTRR